MNGSQIVQAVRLAMTYAALVVAVVSVARLVGVSPQFLRGSITELAAVGILCALVSK